jgi:hypothetical protein
VSVEDIRGQAFDESPDLSKIEKVTELTHGRSNWTDMNGHFPLDQMSANPRNLIFSEGDQMNVMAPSGEKGNPLLRVCDPGIAQKTKLHVFASINSETRSTKSL